MVPSFAASRPQSDRLRAVSTRQQWWQWIHIPARGRTSNYSRNYPEKEQSWRLCISRGIDNNQVEVLLWLSCERETHSNRGMLVWRGYCLFACDGGVRRRRFRSCSRCTSWVFWWPATREGRRKWVDAQTCLRHPQQQFPALRTLLSVLLFGSEH